MSSATRPGRSLCVLSEAGQGHGMVCREVAPYANLGDAARIVTYGHFLDVVR